MSSIVRKICKHEIVFQNIIIITVNSDIDITEVDFINNGKKSGI